MPSKKKISKNGPVNNDGKIEFEPAGPDLVLPSFPGWPDLDHV